MLLLVACSKPVAPPFSDNEMLPGGGMTAKRLSSRTYVEPGRNLDNMQKLNFWTGFSLFRDPWVIAPSSTLDRDGLGPLFNTRSCISCHTNGGRGDMSIEGISKPSALVLRFGPTSHAAVSHDPNYGGQLQPRAISMIHTSMDEALKGEAQLNLSYKVHAEYQLDGQVYTLKMPNYQLTDLAYGELADGIAISPRLAPNIYGLGLLDAIAEADLLALEDTDDVNNDGISARYNRVEDVLSGEVALGRFGLKAKQPNLRQQVAAAFRDDIGITNTVFPAESCTEVQATCAQLAQIGGHDDVEIPNKLLKLVMDFSQFVAVPPTRNLASDTSQKGREVFHASQCATCHQPSFTTDPDYPITALANQTIWPYTDLALHDMGDALADGVLEHTANGREWRTPPLWGIGLKAQYSQQQTYLHDGRAASITEAILWHGGEAEQSKQAFIALNKQERQALITFLASI